MKTRRFVSSLTAGLVALGLAASSIAPALPAYAADTSAAAVEERDAEEAAAEEAARMEAEEAERAAEAAAQAEAEKAAAEEAERAAEEAARAEAERAAAEKAREEEEAARAAAEAARAEAEKAQERTKVEVPAAPRPALVYNGRPQVAIYETDLYAVKEGQATDADDYTAVLSLRDKDSYAWAAKDADKDQKVKWEIRPLEVKDAVVSLDAQSYTADGKEKKPAVTVRIGATTLAALGISANILANGAKDVDPAILEAHNAAILARQAVLKDAKADVTLFKEKLEYKVSYSDNVKPGTGKVKIEFTGNFAGKAEATFTIAEGKNAAQEPADAEKSSEDKKESADDEGEADAAAVDEDADKAPADAQADAEEKKELITGDPDREETSTDSANAGETDEADAEAKVEKVAIPTARTGLAYTGAVQTGVEAAAADADKYTVTGGTATDAGTYTATLKLVQPTAGTDTATGEDSQSASTGDTAAAAEEADSAQTAVAYVWDDGTEEGTADDQTVSWTISPKTLDKTAVTIADQTYDGKKKTPKPVVKDGTTTLKEGTDYTVGEYSDNIDAGTAKCEISFKGNYTGTVTASFTINKAEVAAPTARTGLVYNGKAQSGVTDSADSELYSLKNEKQTDADDYTATATLKDADNYMWSDGTEDPKKIKYTIAQATVDVPTARTGLVYNQKTQTGVASDDLYTLGGEYSAVDAGAYTATAKLADTTNYTWADGTSTQKSISWKISPAPFDPATTTVTVEDQTYSGAAKTPKPTVTMSDAALEQGQDFQVQYANNVNAGTATCSVTFTGNYSGTYNASFKINPFSVTSANATVTIEDQTYDGKAKTPAPTVKIGNYTLTAGRDYDVTYKDNTNAGTATATITCKGNFTGTLTKEFKIVQPVKYSCTAGAGQTWTKSATTTTTTTGTANRTTTTTSTAKNLSFTFKRNVDDDQTFSHFTGVLMDGKAVAQTNYTAVKGSVVITFKAAYLQTLTNGKHTVTAVFNDATEKPTADFTVKAATSSSSSTTNRTTSATRSPRTGDQTNIAVWVGIAALAVIAIGAVIVYKKKSGK